MMSFGLLGNNNQQAQQEALKKAQLERQLQAQQNATNTNAGLSPTQGALSKPRPKPDKLANRPVLRTLRNVARAGLAPITSDPQAAQKKAANPFYKDPADAFWAGMGQDVADAMLGINRGSNAMAMMNEARMMQPETQMQYIDYQIKKQQLDDMEALRQVNIKLSQPAQQDNTTVPSRPSSSVSTPVSQSVITPVTQSSTPYLDEEERVARAYLNSPNLSLQAAGREMMANIGKERRALANKGGQKVVDDRTLRALLPQIATKGADGQWVQNPNADPNLVSQYNDAYMRRHGPTRITDPVTKATTIQQSTAPTDLLVPPGMPQPETPGQIYKTQFDKEVIDLDLKGLSESQTKRGGFANRMTNAAQQMAAKGREDARAKKLNQQNQKK